MKKVIRQIALMLCISLPPAISFSMNCIDFFSENTTKLSLFEVPDSESNISWMNLKDLERKVNGNTTMLYQRLTSELVSMNRLRKSFSNTQNNKDRANYAQSFTLQAKKTRSVLIKGLEELAAYKKKHEIIEFKYIDIEFRKALDGYNEILFDALTLNYVKDSLWKSLIIKKHPQIRVDEFLELGIFESEVLPLSTLAHSVILQVQNRFIERNPTIKDRNLDEVNGWYRGREEEKNERLRSFHRKQNININKYSLTALIAAEFLVPPKINSYTLTRELLEIRTKDVFDEALNLLKRGNREIIDYRIITDKD